MGQGVHSKGMTFAKGDGASPEVFTTVPGVTDVPEISAMKTMIQSTDMADTIHSYTHGLGDPQQFTLECRYKNSDATHAAIIADYDAETASNYRITTPDSPASVYLIRCKVVGWTAPKAGIDELLTQSFTFQCIENENGDIITES